MDNKLKLYDAEYRFALIVWEYEPIQSRQLANICEEKLGWKRPTTYTVLRKLCNRQILKNENAIVTSLIKKEAIHHYESTTIIDQTFGGSLPNFITAFLKDKKLSHEEADKIRALIDTYKED